MRAEALTRPNRHVCAIESHDARCRLPHAHQEARERRLARRARTDDAERLARRDGEGNAADDRPVRALHAEEDAVRLEATARGRQVRRRIHRRIGGEQLIEPSPGKPRLDQVAPAGD